jgi:hypothetical protein
MIHIHFHRFPKCGTEMNSACSADVGNIPMTACEPASGKNRGQFGCVHVDANTTDIAGRAEGEQLVELEYRLAKTIKRSLRSFNIQGKRGAAPLKSRRKPSKGKR